MLDSTIVSIGRHKSRAHAFLLILLIPVLAGVHHVGTCYPFGIWGIYHTSPGEAVFVKGHPYSRGTTVDVATWNWATNESKINGTLAAGNVFSFLCDGRRLVSLDYRGVQRLRMTDIPTFRTTASWAMHDFSTPFPAHLMGLSSNGSYVVVHLGGTSEKLQILDARSGAVTQEVGFMIPGSGSHSRCVPRDCVLVASGIDPKSRLPLRMPSSFELGKFEPVGRETIEQIDCFRAGPGLQLERVKQDNELRYTLRDANSNILFSMNRPEDSSAMDLSPDGMLLAFHGLDLTKIEVLETQTGRTLRQLDADGERPRLASFSADSKQLIGATEVGSLYVWDLTTGARLAEYRPYRWRNHWLAGISVLLVGWCSAWLVIRDRDAHIAWRCADIVIVTGLILLAVFLKYLEGGPMWDLLRLPAITSVSLLLGMSSLVGLFVIFGTYHGIMRLSLGTIAIALVWVPVLFIWRRYADDFGFELFFGSLMVIAAVLMLGAIVRGRGYQIVGRQGVDKSSLRGVRFSTRDVFCFTAAVGVALMAVRLISLPRDFSVWTIGFGFLLAWSQAGIVYGAVWLVLGERISFSRALVFVVGAALLAFAVPFPYRTLSMLPIVWYGAMQIMVGLYIAIAMLLIRAAGYRLCRA